MSSFTLHGAHDRILCSMRRRGVKDGSARLQAALSADKERKEAQARLDELNHLLKKQSGAFVASAAKGDEKAAERIKSEVKELKEALSKEQRFFQEVSDRARVLILSLPNLLHETVPEGLSTEDNAFVRAWGYEHSGLHDAPSSRAGHPHWELAKKHGILAFEEGALVTGSGFPFYVGKGATLVRAMINYFLQEAVKVGYMEIHPPLLINETAGLGTGQLPDKDGQMYKLEGLPYYLVPTAEVPVTNFYGNRTLRAEELPLRLVSYTPCFRKEAGSWGAQVRGLNRLHQFDKVEIVEVCPPEQSYRRLEEMVAYVEGLLKNLGLPYRVVKLCGGDTGFCAAMTYDLEVYAIAQKKWLEVSSVSNFESFQSERIRLSYKNKKGKKERLHTLNGSALALPRVLACLLEHYQQPDESIVLPEALIPFTGFERIP